MMNLMSWFWFIYDLYGKIKYYSSFVDLPALKLSFVSKMLSLSTQVISLLTIIITAIVSFTSFTSQAVPILMQAFWFSYWILSVIVSFICNFVHGFLTKGYHFAISTFYWIIHKCSLVFQQKKLILDFWKSPNGNETSKCKYSSEY